MTETNAASVPELEDILQRLESAKAGLIEAIESSSADSFDRQNAAGESVKKTLERAADEVNFYYGRLASKALNLPQPPCIGTADFLSIREALMSLQVAHRRFGNLLHDLMPGDLDRATEDDHAAYNLRQVLEMAIAHYNRRSQQLRDLAPKKRRRAPNPRPQ